MNNREEIRGKNLQDQQICRGWLSILEGLRKENTALLDRLTASLRYVNSREFLDQAEAFQEKMISKNESLKLLRHEVMEQLDWLDIVPQPSEEAPHDWPVLTQDMRKMQEEFEKMKAAFNNLLRNWQLE